MNQKIRFSINVPYDQYLRVYQGLASNISVLADDGRRLAIPARNLQPYLTNQGIQGYFEMELTPENKFVGIKKLGVN